MWKIQCSFCEGIYYLPLHYNILLFIIKEIDIQLEKAKRHSRLAFFLVENIKTPIQHLLVKCYTCSRQLASLGGEVLVEVFIIYFLAPLHVGLILILVEYLLNSSKKK